MNLEDAYKAKTKLDSLARKSANEFSKNQQEAYEKFSANAEKIKQQTEFNRYKQDCRKRALEMAHAEQMNLTAASRADKGGEVNVTKLADIYYNWLISIPNK